jgi:hypothetical protein
MMSDVIVSFISQISKSVLNPNRRAMIDNGGLFSDATTFLTDAIAQCKPFRNAESITSSNNHTTMTYQPMSRAASWANAS